MHHVIVGAGPAGVVAAETLRAADPGARITLVGDEGEPPYSRMAIPYHLVDNITEQGTYLRKREGWYEGRRIELVDDRVTAVDPASHTLSLAGGETLEYHRLLLACGSSAVKPPVEGVEQPGVYNCWTLADAREIIARATPGERVVLMGAGFIGCIILEALASRGVKLTVVEMGETMVPRMMNPRSGDLLKQWCESKGVEVLTGIRVEGIGREADGTLTVNLQGGGARRAALVIAATGVTPNTGFLEGSGIAVDDGVVVDEFLRTTAADVYAAGDVARGLDFSTRNFVVQAIQPTAVEHGRLAAINMAGGAQVVHRGSLNMNVLDTMGLVSTSFGAWDGVEGGDSAEYFDADRYMYVNLQFDGDRLVGANTLGLTRHVGAMRGLVQTALPLGARGKQALLDNPAGFAEAYLRATQGAALGL